MLGRFYKVNLRVKLALRLNQFKGCHMATMMWAKVITLKCVVNSHYQGLVVP